MTRREVESPVDKVLREGTVVGLASPTVLIGKRREVRSTTAGRRSVDEAGAVQGVVRVPAAALTAHARAEDRLRVLNAEYMMHIPKPVEPAKRVAVVASITRFMAP